MYEVYWKLSSRPFEDGAYPDFYSASPSHQASLLKLRYLIQQNKGIGLLLGDHGLGKTYLTHVLERECHDDGIGPFIRLVFPCLAPGEILNYFAMRLGIQTANVTATESVLIQVEEKLREIAKNNGHPVFVIDDAHLLDVEHLDVLRLLLNLHEQGTCRFSMILSGRSDLLSRVQRIKALDQRASVRMALQPLTYEQVQTYIADRLGAAGAEEIFDQRAVRTIWELAQGVPRRINQLCDLALLVGFVDQLPLISPVEVEAAADELVCIQA
ncbi:ExeA family protein [Thalassoglobus sp.]|uniref:ExeA family protein n=1 Tax=Thalassoglobus sp. TaxID=2795869 RepID=UPI003AA8533A